MTALVEPIYVEDVATVPMDEALANAAELLGIQIQLTGGSGFGWSRESTLQQCPHKYFLRYKRKQKGGPKSPALDLGGVIHAFLALYYQRFIDDAKGAPLHPEPGVLCDTLLDVGASAILVNEGWRLFDAYASFWEQHSDYIKPLAVEYRVADPEEPRTCRYDLIAEVTEHANVLPGIYVFNHKSTSRLTRDLTEGYHLDGQILDEITLYNRAGLHRKFGPLQGAVINLIVKTAVPGFHREWIAPPLFQIRRQTKDLRVQRALLGIYEATNTWPRSLAACWGRYGPCEFWEHCREGK